MKNEKNFDRSIAFTFYAEWHEMAKEIEEDYGKEVVADFYNAIIEYALFEVEPEKKAPLKYFWAQLKEKIDASQAHRAKGFGENVELNEKILQYEQENPEATYRMIAEAVGCSVGKISKVLGRGSNSTTATSTNTITPTTTTTTTVNMNSVNMNMNSVNSVNSVNKGSNVHSEAKNNSPERELSPIELILLEEAEQAKAKTETEEVVSTSGEDIFVHGMREQREQAVAFVDDEYECGSDEELPF